MKSFNKVQGLSFSPYMDGQDPNQGVQIPESQLRDRMSIIAPYTVWVRSYAVDHGLEKSGLVAHDLGLKIALGAWLSGNLSANGTEIATLIECGRAGQADILVVGSETLQRGDLTDQQLIGYIHQVRQSVPDIAITTSDTYGKLLAYPAVIEAVDIVLANIYPFWESIPLDQAIAALAERYGEVKRKAGGKQVWVAETGWPSCGDPMGGAVPSLKNANDYFASFEEWARANSVMSLYFEAFDERWKAGVEGTRGACWGLWTAEGVLKPGMVPVFES